MASIKRRGNVVRVQLRPEERMVLGSLAGELVELLAAQMPKEDDPLATLTGMSSGARERPGDPALQRLLPDAYADPEGAAEFRRLMDDDLRRGKSELLARLAADVEASEGVIELTREQADGWVRAINDLRLVLGVRIGVDDDDSTWRRSLAPDDRRLALVAAYDWLTMVQEMLVGTLF